MQIEQEKGGVEVCKMSLLRVSLFQSAPTKKLYLSRWNLCQPACASMCPQRNWGHVREKEGLLFNKVVPDYLSPQISIPHKSENSGCSTKIAMLDWTEVGSLTCNFKIERSISPLALCFVTGHPFRWFQVHLEEIWEICGILFWMLLIFYWSMKWEVLIYIEQWKNSLFFNTVQNWFNWLCISLLVILLSYFAFQIISLLNVFTPQKSLEEFQDV